MLFLSDLTFESTIAGIYCAPPAASAGAGVAAAAGAGAGPPPLPRRCRIQIPEEALHSLEGPLALDSAP